MTDSNLEPRLVRVETDLEHLKNESVLHKDVTSMIAPIREEQIRQGATMTQLADNVSRMAESNAETNRTVNKVLETYNDNLLAAKDAEIENAKAASAWNWFQTKFLVVMGGIGTVSAAGVIIYAIIQWISKN